MSRARLWLIIDSNYLCYRALHSTGELSYRGAKTGVAYGFLREIRHLAEEFQPDGIGFAFDSRYSLRREIFPEYKDQPARRKKIGSEEDRLMWSEFFRQVEDLRKTHLHSIGFRNIFCERGYEADDVIASICQTMTMKEKAIIVSADKDLLQCLSTNVSIWDSHKRAMITFKQFRDEWGLFPADWASVKAFAGCSSDNIDGLKGVGDKTAAKWVRGEIGKDHRLFESFVQAAEWWPFNMRLVRLPYKGCPDIVMKRDGNIDWLSVARSLGAKTLERQETKPRKTRRVLPYIH